MENAYNINRTLCDEITSCRFALVSKFFKIQNTNKFEELINLRNFLSKIGELEKAMMNHSTIDTDTLEVIKEYIMDTKTEYRTKAK